MRRYLVILIIFIQIQAIGLGLGFIIGEPTGISVKNWITSKNAIDFAAGWSFSEHKKVHFVCDYLFHFPEWVADPGWFPYLGIGGSLEMREESDDELKLFLGPRFGIGAEYIYQKFGFFGELYPVMFFIPESDFSVEGGLGARFYIN